MSDRQIIRMSVLDGAMAPMAESTHGHGSFGRLASDAVGAAGGFAGGARWLRACFERPSGESFEWALCEIREGEALDDFQLARDHVLTRRCSLRLMPDFGGADLWLPEGGTASLGQGARWTASDAELGAFDIQIKAWQSRFERGCPCDLGAGEPDPFDWPSFQSKATALALRSLAVVDPPLHVEQPSEWEHAPARAAAGLPTHPEAWLPSWGAAAGIESDACAALVRLDEDSFASMVRAGARQSAGSPMPWAAYCAHMGLSKALGALLACEPGAAELRCLWGCSPLEAALAACQADCVALCMDASPWRPASKPLSTVAALADAALSEPEGAGQAALLAWGMRGGDLSFSEKERERFLAPAQGIFESAAALASSLRERGQIEDLIGSSSRAVQPARSL